MCDRDELREVNMKLDHIMYVQCELFAMMKATGNTDAKLDKCIQLLNKLNSSLNAKYPIVNTNVPVIPPPPLPPSNKSKAKPKPKPNPLGGISLQDQLLKELKQKLEKRGGIQNYDKK